MAGRGERATVKRALGALLAAYDLAGIAALAETRSRVLGALVPFTFDRDPLIAWRTVEAMGAAAERIQGRQPDAVREYLRRLNWLITEESGGICWRAPEAMAEIVARLPGAYPEFIPIVVHLLAETAEDDLRHFRVGMVWAIGRLGPVAAPHVADMLPLIEDCLAHPDSQVRGTAVWALARVGRADRVAARPALRDDAGRLAWYRAGVVEERTVGEMARADAFPTPDAS